MKIVEKLGKDFFSSDMNKVINDTLLGNDTFKSTYLQGEKNNEELINLNNIISEIKINGIKAPIADNAGNLELEKIRNSANDQIVIEIKLKLSDLEMELLELKNQFDRNIKGTLEEEEDDKARELSSLNLRDYIKNVYLNVRNVGEKVNDFFLKI